MEVFRSNFMHAFETNKALVYIYPTDPNIRRVPGVHAKEEPMSSPTRDAHNDCNRLLYQASLFMGGRYESTWNVRDSRIASCRDITLGVVMPTNRLLIRDIKPPSDHCASK